MRRFAQATLVALPLLAAFTVGCDAAPNPFGERCMAPQAGVPITYVAYSENMPEGPQGEGTIAHTGDCAITTLDFEAGRLALALQCPLGSAISGVNAQLTAELPAAGIPTGLALHDTVSLRLSLGEGNPNLGDWGSYTISDSQGLILGLSTKHIDADFGDVTVESEANCGDWQPCSGDADYSGLVHATSDATSLPVHIGQPRELDGGAVSWDVSLFQARFTASDCHGGPSGSVLVLRRPAR